MNINPKNWIRSILKILMVGGAIIFLLLQGIQTFIAHKSYNQQKNSKDPEKEDLEKKKLKKDLTDFEPKFQDITPMEWEEGSDKIGYLGIKDIEEANNSKNQDPVLIFSETQKNHFNNILNDINDFLNDGRVDYNREDERIYNDQYRHKLVRNNCILYGAPGTGKTEFAKELNHVLIKRYGEEDKDGNKTIPTIPIFKINGASLYSTGKDEPKTYEKLIITVKEAKKRFFRNIADANGKTGEECNLPYIVFVDEVDQAKNPFTYDANAKNNLEEFKNFFSQAGEEEGIKNGAQDNNSIFITASNNFDAIDYAMKRRGRLGVKLNFTWTPTLLREYCNLNGLKFPNKDSQWKFEGNRDHFLLFKLAERMNFSTLKSAFIKNTKKILGDWENWDEREKNDYAESKLGLDSDFWCENCFEEVSLENLKDKMARINKEKDNYFDKKEQEKLIKKEKQKRNCSICKGENVKPICNWLLHYLHTFFEYYDKQNLEAFDNPNKIQRYPYSEPRLLRERIKELSEIIAQSNNDILNGLGEELNRSANQLAILATNGNFNNECLAKITDAIKTISQRVEDYLSKIK